MGPARGIARPNAAGSEARTANESERVNVNMTREMTELTRERERERVRVASNETKDDRKPDGREEPAIRQPPAFNTAQALCTDPGHRVAEISPFAFLRGRPQQRLLESGRDEEIGTFEFGNRGVRPREPDLDVC